MNYLSRNNRSNFINAEFGYFLPFGTPVSHLDSSTIDNLYKFLISTGKAIARFSASIEKDFLISPSAILDRLIFLLINCNSDNP